MNADSAGKATWLSNEERGTLLGIRFVVGLCNLAGRRAARAFIYVLSAYYVAFATHGRRASRAWLSFVFGRKATLREVYRHLSTFALVALDRVFLLQGRRELFVLSSHGTENLDALTAQKRGAILLGAHIGSFEAMRARAEGRKHDIRVLAYFENARKITQVLAALAPDMQDKVIPLGSVDALLRAKEAVEGGAMVAMLGDRTGLNTKSTQVTFMGKPAPLPTGPFLLAASLRCPVLLVFGIYRGDNWYEMHCEPFAERIVLPRKDREKALQEYAQAYANRLAELAREHPYNWFNIYDFWNP
jgi:predicted LPLAT superfamily acyltransferase